MKVSISHSLCHLFFVVIFWCSAWHLKWFLIELFAEVNLASHANENNEVFNGKSKAHISLLYFSVCVCVFFIILFFCSVDNVEYRMRARWKTHKCCVDYWITSCWCTHLFLIESDKSNSKRLIISVVGAQFDHPILTE